MLWANDITFLPMPWLLLGIDATYPVKISPLALVGAVLYGVASARTHGGLRALRAVPGLCIVIEVQFVFEGGAEALHPCVVPAPALGRHAAADLVAALIGVDQELLGFDLAVPQGPVGGCWAELLLLQVLGHTIGAVAWVPARPKPASGLGLER